MTLFERICQLFRRGRSTIALFLVLSLIYGFGVGRYQWRPFGLLQNLKHSFISACSSRPIISEEQPVLDVAFSDPLITGQQIYPQIESLDQIHSANVSMALSNDLFSSAYKNLTLRPVVEHNLDSNTVKVIELPYSIAGRDFRAFAYAISRNPKPQRTALIIPGSGFNQASAIYSKDPSNYHFGILNALGNDLDFYILIKPNEDCIALHNGKNKLSLEFIAMWLLNQGASYSGHYIVNSLAFAKFLRENYRSTIVAGLSQGGEAALLNALQSAPDLAIISSGFSVLHEQSDWGSLNQITIPGISKTFSNEAIRARIHQLQTQFLFTYGQNETAYYKMEAQNPRTCSYLDSPRNVRCVVHDQGHIFPQKEISEFAAVHAPR